MAAHMPQRLDRALQELKEYYCKFVRNNQETVGQIESGIRIFSFLVAGRFENGPVLSELIYSASNLLVLLNDHVFKAAAKIAPKLNISLEKLMRWLTVLEYVEVFLEMAAQKKWGDKGAWVVISVIQLTKTALRLFMLLCQRSGIQPTPPISPLDREAVVLKEEHDNLEDVWEEEFEEELGDGTYTLPSSGRRIRTLDAAPPFSQRSWNVPPEGSTVQQQTNGDIKRKQLQLKPSPLNRNRLFAEGLHISRPVAHLCGMFLFGRASWKPWLLACGMDVSSMCLMGETTDLNAREKSELKRRSLMLLYYLLRSPFYDKYSKAKILMFLGFLADHIPLVGLLLRPLIHYLPDWQRMYFYVWST